MSCCNRHYPDFSFSAILKAPTCRGMSKCVSLLFSTRYVSSIVECEGLKADCHWNRWGERANRCGGSWSSAPDGGSCAKSACITTPIHFCKNVLLRTRVCGSKGLTFKYCRRASNSAFLIESLYTVSNLNMGNKQLVSQFQNSAVC